MREILFRGKRIDNGEWVYGFYVETLDIKNEDFLPPFEKKKYIFTSWEESLLSNEDNGGIFEIIPETIGQFTGILDVKGNKIFEGDTLEFPFDLGQAYVVYDGIRFAVKSEGSEAIDYEPSEVLKQCEIIGNIHDVK